jgi:hypothetical protein
MFIETRFPNLLSPVRAAFVERLLQNTRKLPKLTPMDHDVNLTYFEGTEFRIPLLNLFKRYDQKVGQPLKPLFRFIIGPNFVLSLEENYGEIFTSIQNRPRNAQGRINC